MECHRVIKAVPSKFQINFMVTSLAEGQLAIISHLCAIKLSSFFLPISVRIVQNITGLAMPGIQHTVTYHKRNSKLLFIQFLHMVWLPATLRNSYQFDLAWPFVLGHQLDFSQLLSLNQSCWICTFLFATYKLEPKLPFFSLVSFINKYLLYIYIRKCQHN